jgi:hypothetical protein
MTSPSRTPQSPNEGTGIGGCSSQMTAHLCSPVSFMHRNFAQAADTENFIDQTGIVHLMHQLNSFDTGHLCSMSSPAGFISAATSLRSHCSKSSKRRHLTLSISPRVVNRGERRDLTIASGGMAAYRSVCLPICNIRRLASDSGDA